MLQRLPIIAVITVLIATGVVSGMWTKRWSGGAALSADNRMTLPVMVGDWDSREDAVDARVLKISQAAAIDRRWYINRTTGAAVSVSLVYGDPGPVAVHTPDVCYAGSGFEETASAAIREVEPNKPDRFLVRQFRKQGPAPMTLTVYYGWNAGDHWQVHDNPRIAFAGKPALYKLYVNYDTTAAVGPDADLPALEFLRALLPVLKESVPAGSQRLGN
jgi:hypothetical protein